MFCVRGSTTGRMNWADREYAIGRGVAAIRHKSEPGIHPFVRAVIEHELPNLLAQATGSTFPNVSSSQLAAIPYPVLSLPEQRAIAHILGTLDDKIELNRRMNQTLEEMARSLFKSWFVDFDPVRAKIDGRWRAGESLPGLPADLYHVFPDRLVPSQLGETPEGWEVSEIGDVLELAYGKALKEQDRRSGDVPVFGSNGRVGCHDEKLVDGPGMVVGRKGNPGTVTWSSVDFFPIDTTFYVVPKIASMGFHFLYHALSKQDLPSIAADSAVPGLNRNLAYMNPLLIPPDEAMDAFKEQVVQLAARQDQFEQESSTLAAQRDAMLPILLLGQTSRMRSALRLISMEVYGIDEPEPRTNTKSHAAVRPRETCLGE